jgi:hypothetical protein
VKGKWAQGIQPRGFHWIIKDQLAVCERPGGYGPNHRRVRRQEEIIWIREQGFSRIVSLIPSPHNLHNYDELHMPWWHVPHIGTEGDRERTDAFYAELDEALLRGERLIVHREVLDDVSTGLLAGFLLWRGLVRTAPEAVTVMERLVSRQMGPAGRSLVALAERSPTRRGGGTP